MPSTLLRLMLMGAAALFFSVVFAVSGAVSSASADDANPLDGASSLLGSVTAPVAEEVRSVTAVVAPVVPAVTAPVAPVATAVTAPVAPVVSAVVAPVAPVVTAVVAPLAPVVTSITLPLAPIIAPPTQPVGSPHPGLVPAIDGVTPDDAADIAVATTALADAAVSTVATRGVVGPAFVYFPTRTATAVITDGGPGSTVADAPADAPVLPVPAPELPSPALPANGGSAGPAFSGGLPASADVPFAFAFFADPDAASGTAADDDLPSSPSFPSDTTPD